MKLYGTTTSPFVRRVRAVAHEVGEPIDRIDTAPDAGHAALLEVSPIRRVPVAVIDARAIFDSRVIIDWLTTTHGWHELSPPRDRWRDSNIVNAIDAALDAVIQLYYLRRDGVAIDGTPYAERQLDRADSIFAWLGTQLTSDGKGFEPGFGVAELSLVCALDWMDFRNSYPTKKASLVESVREAWRDRPSLAASRPHA